MSVWVLVFIVLVGGLFALKILYLGSIAAVLPVTKGALFVSTSGLRIKAFLDAVPMQPQKTLHPASGRHGDPIYIYQLPEACGP
ncbi:MAG: hypothetical protein JRI95_07930 [Deltaproteobacteria bacterium]|nr:hypothetical protein [Deltaproteobacteria bacterium]